MLIKATQKYTRQTPRKIRLVANAVKGLSVVKAVEQLGLIERKASIVVLKVLRQALASAEHNFALSADQLKIQSILVVPGPTYKRFRAVSRGRAHSILKRTAHITVVLEAKDVKPSSVVKTEVKKLDKKKDSAHETATQVARPTVKEMKKGKSMIQPQAKPAGGSVKGVRRTTHK